MYSHHQESIITFKRVIKWHERQYRIMSNYITTIKWGVPGDHLRDREICSVSKQSYSAELWPSGVITVLLSFSYSGKCEIRLEQCI